MYLISPRTYVSLTDFKAMPSDFDISSYSDADLTSMLVAASGWCNGIMRDNLLAQEETRRYEGTGTDRLDLGRPRVLYLKSAKIMLPGATPFYVSTNELLIDYEGGSCYVYAPLYWQGAGYRSVFPRGAPIDITLGWGLGYTVAKAPALTLVDLNGGQLTAGNKYNIAVTARTFWGETSAVPTIYTPATTGIKLTVMTGLGVYTYRLYTSDGSKNTTTTQSRTAGQTSVTVTDASGVQQNAYWLYDSGIGVQELVQVASVVGSTVNFVAPLQYAHNTTAQFIPVPTLQTELPVIAFGTNPMTYNLSALTPTPQLYVENLPMTDTSAPPIPNELSEAVRLCVYSRIFEQNNLANRGISQEKSGERMTSWRSTEGTGGRGEPTLATQARAMLNNLTFNGIL